jgi:alkanesulfonate monooxygenase SsuD/methylene tetrahydromethanopterin reductase-like flavin-dependent oxidoreductase (luciferase family)
MFEHRHLHHLRCCDHQLISPSPHPPIWIGGTGRRRTLRIVAEHADVWNAPGGSPSEVAELSAVLDEHCAAVGRDPTEIRRSVQVRLPENPDELLPLVEQYAEVGIGDVILIVMGGTSEAQSRQAAAILPRLKSVD